MKQTAAFLLLILLAGSLGCQPQPSQMAKLGMETLGLVIVTDMPDVEPLVTAYVQAKLPKVKIIGSQAVWTHLEGTADGETAAALENRENLTRLREDLAIEYLAVISIEKGESPRHSTSITVGTDKSEIRLRQYLTVDLNYTVIDTSSGEKIFTGRTQGRSSDIAGLKVGTEGTQVGIQLSRERSLLKEAVRDALRETGIF